ncbi:MAG: hypothetical protein COA47_10940 [Robiginitomaculum sp.]|nr:MAG: hypothetical protein COA47_10940 [Robiginitomaculum sp.]
METSILIAKILGPLYLVSGFAWVFNRDAYGKMMTDFTQQRGLLYVSAVLAFLFGAVILTFHNIWTANWQVLITMLGFLGLLKGLTLLVFPEMAMKMANALIGNQRLTGLLFVVVFMVGAILVWFGYLA